MFRSLAALTRFHRVCSSILRISSRSARRAALRAMSLRNTAGGLPRIGRLLFWPGRVGEGRRGLSEVGSTQDDHALDDVFEFADVAGIVVSLQTIEHLADELEAWSR